LREARAWLEAGLGLRRIALNLDICQVQAEDWAEPLLAMIGAGGLSPDRVELEVSERILETADVERLAKGLTRLRQRGVLVSLDDFGAGYGSLTQLARLPVDLVKLDARLLWDADTTPRTRTLVQGVVALTTTLELPCLFEGIETPRQLALAHGVGARFGQGFHLSRPIEAGAVPAVLRSHKPIRLAAG
jgi:EAL domain-containing protein (putative c-di-GMP-specific phosphodiesterase class I)